MNFERNPDAVCKESWWLETNWETFTTKRLEREKVLRPAFGSQPVSTVPSRAEQSFMDKVKGSTC